MMTSENNNDMILKARSHEFSKIYATNVVINETDSDLRLSLFNEIITTDEERIAISDGTAILTYQAAVLLYEQLKDLIENWEMSGRMVQVSEERRRMLDLLKEG